MPRSECANVPAGRGFPIAYSLKPQHAIFLVALSVWSVHSLFSCGFSVRSSGSTCQVKSSQNLLFSGIQSIQQERHMKIHNLPLTKLLQNKQFHVK